MPLRHTVGKHAQSVIHRSHVYRSTFNVTTWTFLNIGDDLTHAISDPSSAFHFIISRGRFNDKNGAKAHTSSYVVTASRDGQYDTGIHPCPDLLKSSGELLGLSPFIYRVVRPSRWSLSHDFMNPMFTLTWLVGFFLIAIKILPYSSCSALYEMESGFFSFWFRTFRGLLGDQCWVSSLFRCPEPHIHRYITQQNLGARPLLPGVSLL